MENLVGTLVKQSHDAALAARRNRARIDSEPHNSFGFCLPQASQAAMMNSPNVRRLCLQLVFMA